ncbi:ribosome-binding factor A [Erysipelotrichaceae bacterium]|nr:ribosome-binding factor A [Erysipelotrichaceae bacterium]
MTSIKHQRLESQLQRALSEIIAQDLKNKDMGLVSITAVELTNDLSYLTVFVHFMNSREDKQEANLETLEKKSGAIKAILGKKVSLRKMPELIFKIDTSFAEAEKIEGLLKKVNNE